MILLIGERRFISSRRALTSSQTFHLHICRAPGLSCPSAELSQRCSNLVRGILRSPSLAWMTSQMHAVPTRRCNVLAFVFRAVSGKSGGCNVLLCTFAAREWHAVVVLSRKKVEATAKSCPPYLRTLATRWPRLQISVDRSALPYKYN